MEQFGGRKLLKKTPTKKKSASARRYMKYLNKPSDTKISGDKKKINVNPPKNQRKKRKNVNESREKALTRTTLRMLQGAPSQQKKAPPSPSPAPPPAPVPTRSTAPAPAPAPAPPPARVPAPTPALASAPPKKKLKRSKKSTKRHTKRNNSRQVKVSKPTVLTDEHIKRVEKKIQNIRKQKLSDMKKELEKRGVKTTGKSNRLLKDIYLYSKMSNINFKHEK